jgi:hypothetical protein
MWQEASAFSCANVGVPRRSKTRRTVRVVNTAHNANRLFVTITSNRQIARRPERARLYGARSSRVHGYDARVAMCAICVTVEPKRHVTIRMTPEAHRNLNLASVLSGQPIGDVVAALAKKAVAPRIPASKKEPKR